MKIICARCLQIQKEHPDLTARELSSTGNFDAVTFVDGTAFCEVHARLSIEAKNKLKV